MVIDPVCQMHLNELATSAEMAPTATVEHDGRIYYFCSETCRERFEENPARYIPQSALK